MAVRTQQPVNRPIIDGFMYNPLLRYLPMRYIPLALEHVHQFRTGLWQPRQYTAPVGDGGAIIPAGRTITEQIRTAVSGCYLIGYNFATLTDTPANFGVVVVDSDVEVPGTGTSSYGGYPLTNGINRYVIGSEFSPASIVGSQGSSGLRLVLLTKPYPITGDLLTVKLSNLDVINDVRAQFVLYVMEPCDANG